MALLRYGWIETIAACMLGVGLLTIAFSIYNSIPLTRWITCAAVILTIAGLASFVVAAFQTVDSDIINTQVVLHRGAVAIIAAAFPSACFLLLPSMLKERPWRRLAAFDVTAGTIAIAIIAIVASLPHPLQQSTAGLWERMLVADGIIWCQVIAVHLLLLSRKTTTGQQ